MSGLSHVSSKNDTISSRSWVLTNSVSFSGNGFRLVQQMDDFMKRTQFDLLRENTRNTIESHKNDI
ncbi:hypothetical protein BpHYR1_050981 [Brachionus plicatilis]|uniref:Uncharacterized protein n=1 Tax=Brachionus plicatilis TaxID=10195 RepID=A0A3M7QXP4_BRAPC|nr:hypothetical protein BpHYR1_050981 [Brachionus plicatilis]